MEKTKYSGMRSPTIKSGESDFITSSSTGSSTNAFFYYTKFDGSLYLYVTNNNNWNSITMNVYYNGSPVFDSSVPALMTRSFNGVGSQPFIEATFSLTQGSSYTIAWKNNSTSEYEYAVGITVMRTLSQPVNLFFDNSDRLNASFQGNKPIFEVSPMDTSTSDYPFSYAIRKYFYDVCLRDNEDYGFKWYFGDDTILRRWTKPSVTYKCIFNSSVPVGSRSTYQNRVIAIVAELNSIITSINLSVIESGTADINVTFGTRAELFPIETTPDGNAFYYNGQWWNQDSGGSIYTGWVKIVVDSDLFGASATGLLREELGQVLGSGNDWIDYTTSAFFQGQNRTRALNSYAAEDVGVLQLLYNHNLPVGANHKTIAKLINVPLMVEGIDQGSGQAYRTIGDYLKNGTNYKFRAFAVAYGSYHDYFSDFSGYTTFTTPSVPTKPSPVDFSSRIEGGFNLFWGQSAGATIYYLNYKASYNTGYSVASSPTPSYVLSSSYYGTTMDFRVRGVNGELYGDYSDVSSWTTAPKTPTITVGPVTNSSISIKTGSMSGNYSDIEIQRYDVGSVYMDTKSVQANGTATWEGLPSGATYIFKARSRFYINNIDLYSVSFSNHLTVSTSNRPTNFEWASAKNSGENFNLSAAEWNAFTAKVDAFRAYKGLGAYGFTSVFTGLDFAAWIFNQGVNGINGMSPPTAAPTTKSAGEAIYASYLNGLVNALKSL
ncbi:DUF2927 domain-containing protein [Paenibacillus radicis (ex Xue et al. 2023)]|uniref:DUF2927 domain-containing protein n=1 Tax=Paenibacillus radicis (ex Xue et al. 2023) TaxID=2972489 RepID=A0ABT1YJZ7_9BACL|nr:DUF2927 domain-containing protein [Paenibacillus radicis (ex Xue et al. 2023)]MCR8633502.1 DUF2927 domain-containing protein [Paenibacillus radicis (ex Xue et al. 2023)]